MFWGATVERQRQGHGRTTNSAVYVPSSPALLSNSKQAALHCICHLQVITLRKGVSVPKWPPCQVDMSRRTSQGSLRSHVAQTLH
jgi:hypothetical protein